MANQILKKFIGENQVDESKILLSNDASLKGKNAAGNAEIDIIKVNGDDKVVLQNMAEPLANGDATTKLYVDTEVGAVGDDLQSHIDQMSDAHDASAISFDPIPSGMDAVTVQAAIEELKSDFDGISLTASAISYDNSMSFMDATNVQGAIDELKTGLSNTSNVFVAKSGDVMTGDLTINGGLYLYDNTENQTTTLQIDPNGFDQYMQGLNGDAFAKSGILLNNTSEAQVTNTTANATHSAYTQSVSVGTVAATTMSASGSGDVKVKVRSADDLDNYAQMEIGNTIYKFTEAEADFDGKEIIDLAQVSGLNPATASGNAVRWDEVGAYSISAGYGLATLDSGGKIPAEQLPNAVMEYKGTWDASTNTPTLANGSPANNAEDAGHLYIVSAGGTVNFGAGNISFNAGDSVILSASLIWEKSTTANLVTSVNGAQGVVVLDAEDLSYHQVNTSDWTVADDSSIKATLDEVGSRLTENESDISAIQDDVGHLVTLSGVDVDSDNLGSFTGSTIENNRTVKAALQDLETAHEDHLNDSSGAHNASAIFYQNSASGMSSSDVQMAIDELDGRADELESVTSAMYKATLGSLEIAAGFIDLPYEAYDTNDFHVFADRLALHQGSMGDDYTLSVVSGVTRITWQNDVASGGSQALAAGDTIYVRYKYKA